MTVTAPGCAVNGRTPSVHPLLGDPDLPDSRDPGHVTGFCRREVQRWRLLALGNRDEDWLGRDVSVGAMMRDPRPRRLHELAAHPKPWVCKRVAHLPPQLHRQARQLTALHYRHLLQLAWLFPLARQRALQGKEDLFLLLRKLWRCCPAGAEVQWTGPGSRTPRDQCKHTRLCPWCHTRRVRRVYRRLRDHLASQPRNTYLVLATVSVVGPLSAEQKRYARGLADDTREALCQLGASGGLASYRVGPHRHPDGRPDYRHEVAVLAQVTFADQQQREAFERKMGAHGNPASVCVGAQRHRVTWAMAPADPRTLRQFLAGSGPRFRPPQGLVVCKADQDRRPFQGGFPGALAWVPVFMFTANQWWRYARAFQRTPLYTTFGSWRGSPSSSPGRTPSQRHALRAENDRRQQGARDELDALVRLAAPVYAQLREQGVGPRSRPPLRDRLRQALQQEHGVANLTDWQLRNLLAALAERYGVMGKKALDISLLPHDAPSTPTRSRSRTSAARPRKRPSLPETRSAPAQTGRFETGPHPPDIPDVTLKEIDGFPDRYVGSDGSFWTYSEGGTETDEFLGGEWQEWIYPPDPHTGYVAVPLWNRARQHQTYRHLHLLVLEAFAGPRPSPDHEGCHGNGDRTDNRLANLRWDTREANLADRRAHGTIPRGEQIHNSKLTEDDVREIRRLYESKAMKVKDIAARFNISHATVSAIARHKRWQWVV